MSQTNLDKGQSQSWRLFATGLSFAVFGLGCLCMAIFLSFRTGFWCGKSTTKKHYIRQTISKGCWLFIRITQGLGVLSFSVDGQALLRPSGQLIIANHPTLIDVIFLLALAPEANCVVKAALWRNGFIRSLVRMAGYIQNNSEQLVTDACVAIHHGDSVVIFPEGTRSVPGRALTFKRGAARIALRTDCPVCLVIIRCEPSTLRKNQHWYDIPAHKPHFSLAINAVLPPVVAQTNLQHESLQARHLTRAWLRHFQPQVK
jgi:1-acyl-sn-glycerol-3-phosphate acyltransferase